MVLKSRAWLLPPSAPTPAHARAHTRAYHTERNCRCTPGRTPSTTRPLTSPPPPPKQELDADGAPLNRLRRVRQATIRAYMDAGRLELRAQVLAQGEKGGGGM